MVQQVAGDGNTSSFVYDKMNRLSTASYFDGEVESYAYTLDGMLASVSDSLGTMSYSYDARNRPVTVSNADGSVVGYSYDLVGNRTRVTSPAGTTNYVYNALDRLFSVSDIDGAMTTFDYDPVGNMTSAAMPNGITTAHDYDARYRLTGISHTVGAEVLQQFAYTYDAAGNRTSETALDGTVTAWAYDDAYRLLSETVSVGGADLVTSFAYDDAGNRTAMTQPGRGTTDYTYNEMDQLVSAVLPGVDTTAYAYDDRGNLITQSDSSGVTAYQWSAKDELVGVMGPGVSASYAYDPMGHRTAATTEGVTEAYVWDTFSRYGDVLYQSDTAGNALSFTLAGGMLISQHDAAGTSYFLADALGSTRALTDEAGSISSAYNYDAFGELTAGSVPVGTDYLFTGQQYDASTELYRLRARYYSPSMGRFLSQDTWATNFRDPMEYNRYSYAANNPATYSDPSGHFVDTSQILSKIKAQVVGALSTAGRAVALQYARTAYWVIRLSPWLQGATCLAVSFSTDADIPGCDVPVEELVNAGITSFKRLFVAAPGNPFAEAAELVRRILGSKDGLPPDGGFNISIGSIKINGVDFGWIWGISGQNISQEKRQFVELIEQISSGSGQIADDIIVGMPDFLGSYTKYADDHSERKVLAEIYQTIANLAQKGDVIEIALFTERFPCGQCGGRLIDDAGQYILQGIGSIRETIDQPASQSTIGAFFNAAINNLGVNVQLDTVYRLPFNGFDPSKP